MTRYVYLRFEVDENCTDTDEEIEEQVEAVITELVAPKSWTWDPMGSNVSEKYLNT